MSKDCSFDIVSIIDLQDLDNAVNNTLKEISSRYDLKDSGITLELDKTKKTITMITSSDFHCDQVIDILHKKMVKLSLDLKSIKSKGREPAGGDKVREVFDTINGIEQQLSKQIIKDIKDMKLKVQTSIQGDQLRISGKNKDDLQEVISFIRSKNYDIPLQFVNYR